MCAFTNLSMELSNWYDYLRVYSIWFVQLRLCGLNVAFEIWHLKCFKFWEQHLSGSETLFLSKGSLLILGMTFLYIALEIMHESVTIISGCGMEWCMFISPHIWNCFLPSFELLKHSGKFSDFETSLKQIDRKFCLLIEKCSSKMNKISSDCNVQMSFSMNRRVSMHKIVILFCIMHYEANIIVVHHLHHISSYQLYGWEACEWHWTLFSAAKLHLVQFA